MFPFSLFPNHGSKSPLKLLHSQSKRKLNLAYYQKDLF
jgi:hypothetical protein